MSRNAAIPVAVALHYKGERAPKVVAKGGGLVAERIIAAAKDHGVPLQEDAELAAVLAQLDLNAKIPRDLYVAVAEVLKFVWGLEKSGINRTIP